MGERAEFANDNKFRPTVLIAEDEPIILKLIAKTLEEHGFFTVAVPNGDAAIAIIEKRTAVDIVVSDINMPGARDGFGLARWMAENRPDIPVVLMTGEVSQNVMASDLVTVPILKKPLNMDFLFRSSEKPSKGIGNRAEG